MGHINLAGSGDKTKSHVVICEIIMEWRRMSCQMGRMKNKNIQTNANNVFHTHTHTHTHTHNYKRNTRASRTVATILAPAAT
jgi:hypothetical protein